MIVHFPLFWKNVSVKKFWMLKKSETNLIAKEGMLHDECSGDLKLTPFDDKELGSLSSLSNLKPLCINNLVEDLGVLRVRWYLIWFLLLYLFKRKH